MKKIYSYFSVIYFLFMVILMGCGTADPVSSSAGPSNPSQFVMNLTANPATVPVGGSTVITVTLTNAITGVPGAGETVFVSNSGTASGEDSFDTGSGGRFFYLLSSITAPTTVTFTVEDISVSIRINTTPAAG